MLSERSNGSLSDQRWHTLRRTTGRASRTVQGHGVPAGQRHYYSGKTGNCAKASTIVVTIIAGPLNYLGVNAKVSCKVPQPSK